MLVLNQQTNKQVLTKLLLPSYVEIDVRVYLMDSTISKDDRNLTTQKWFNESLPFPSCHTNTKKFP